MSGEVLRELAPELWIADQPLRFFGLEIGARMTVVRLPDGKLFLHSPIARSHELAAAVEALGAPAFIVAPNRFHHLYAGEWRAAYPGSRLYVAPGLDAKRPDLEISGVLGESAPAEWAGVLDHVALVGFPLTNEVVFLHEPSRTLIASDLLFNLGPESAPLTRFAFRMAGAYGRPSTTALERLMVRNRAAFRRSLEKVLSWPISRVVVAHGEVIETGGHEAVTAAFSWLIGRPAP